MKRADGPRWRKERGGGPMRHGEATGSNRADSVGSRQVLLICVLWLVILLGLHITVAYTYLLFHSLVELFRVVVACVLFALAWNVRRLLERHYLLFLGIGYGFVGLVDLVHALAYKGLGVFPGGDANLPTQLWIAGRVLETIALVAAPRFLTRRLNAWWVLGAFAGVTAILMLAIFHGNFPDCFIEGQGLTAFKRYSEYVITILLGVAAVPLFRHRAAFEPRVLRLVLASIGMTILAELAFTQYANVYALSNEVGHDLKLLSAFLLYRALVHTGLARPYQLLFRELKQGEAALVTARDELEIKVQERTSELSTANAQLRAEIAQREHAEAERSQLLANLRDRVKELTTLYQAARLLQDEQLAPTDVLGQMALLLPLAYKHPEVAAARVRFGDLEEATSGYTETPWKQSAVFTTADGTTGGLDIVYLEGRPAEAESPFLMEERYLLESLAQMLRVHFDRWRAQEELRRVNRALRMTSECNRILVRATDEQELLEHLLRIIVDTGGYQAVWVGFTAGPGRDLQRVAECFSADQPPERRCRAGEDVCLLAQQVVDADDPIVWRRPIGDEGGVWCPGAARCGYGSAVVLPLAAAGQRLGALCIHAADVSAFDDQELPVLRELADDLAYGLAALRNRGALRETMDKLMARTEQLEAVREVSAEITRELNLTALLGVITRRAAELTGAPMCTTLLWDEVGQQFLPRAWHGFGEWMQDLQFSLAEGLVGLLAISHEGLIINDYQHWPGAHSALVEQAGVTAALAEPLQFREQLIGAIVLNHCEAGRSFSEADRKLLAVFAVQAAIAIQNARLFEQVAQGKAEWEETFDSMPDLVAVVGADRRLTRVNRALARRLGTTPRQLIGRHCYAALHGAATPCSPCLQEAVRTGGKSVTHEVTNPHLGGIFLTTASPLSDGDGGTGRCVYILRDVTEVRRLAEEARQRQRFEDLSRAKSAFIATMSHELRTPLNAIIGFSDLLLEGDREPLTEEQAQFVTHVMDSGKHLLQLINNILDLSKIEAGKIVLQPERLEVARILEDILAIARGLANKKGQSLQVEVAPDLPPVHADPIRFKQILFNLLSNAVKFTPNQGAIMVTAKRILHPVGERGPEDPTAGKTILQSAALQPFVQIRVVDTGLGIRTEDFPRLFREFAQLETTRSQHHEGTGLGLALTKRLVELHGGTIAATSDGEGKGSIFTVLLPLEASPRVGEG
jgi:PAS domain S-box-containing protein